MNIVDKIKKSWWVIFSFIMFLNGVGFIYISVRENNRNWLLEGIMYEIPWFLYFIFFGIYGLPKTQALNPSSTIILFAVLLMFVSIVRSIWVAVKLADVYDNEEKYTIKTTVLNNQKTPKGNDGLSSKIGCCICLIAIFIIFMIIAL